MNRTAIFIAAAGLMVLGTASSAFAEQASDVHNDRNSATAASSASLTAGEVRKIDKSAKKITIKHGPIASLDMPAMTMTYPVADPAMLDHVKPGDKILFAAEKAGQSFRVTRIETPR